jgi:hypothetical protein
VLCDTLLYTITVAKRGRQSSNNKTNNNNNTQFHLPRRLRVGLCEKQSNQSRALLISTQQRKKQAALIITQNTQNEHQEIRTNRSD